MSSPQATGADAQATGADAQATGADARATGAEASVRDPAVPATGRPRVLLAPVTITPTKPLTPSHLKGLFWTDVALRASRPLAEVTHRSSHTAFDACEQTLGFWEYLDRTVGDVDYSGLSGDVIGELYMRFRAAGERAPFHACLPYLEAIERHGWVHPASARLLELWAGQYHRLGLHDPGLTAHQPPRIGLAEMIDRLRRLGMCLDLRADGGPVFLDATRDGIPLRQIIAADGRPNYLACALRDLLPLAPEHDEVVLLHDRDLEPDYLLLHRVLAGLGPRVHRITLGRVPIDGRVTSARHGGWQQHGAEALLDEFGDRHDPAALRLGLRLYFIAVLGPGDHDSFRPELLDRYLAKARRLLDAAPDAGWSAVRDGLDAHRGAGAAHVDPYRLTAGLLNRRRAAPARELLTEVYT
ncbi:MAG TPA: hypothetical protein VFV67_31830 [Actinophytocola sp.]|uniref:hypothetical protein n=1 Tax=Actinophytocola sp. TaxID=1872138 RepID=UPI002DBDA82C|nr:hypothetical protein [Actinophytocola sp.]HEU5475257.1 hypothetical protein [Actinophytocola sp.]